jgi:universal stress protein family protein
MGEATERTRASGVPSEVALAAKRGAEALTDVAEERDARMIVVGSYGEPLKGMILGSTPQAPPHGGPTGACRAGKPVALPSEMAPIRPKRHGGEDEERYPKRRAA